MVPHVVVVGAGIVGASVAYHVARRGVAVTLVERGHPASGATGSSFGWIGRYGHWPDGARALRNGVLPHWRRLEDELPDVRVRWTGSLSWGTEASGATDAPLPAQGIGGGDVELLTAAQAAALEPNLRKPPGQAVRVSSDGAVDPLAVTEALAQGARDHGARVLLGVRVTSVHTEASRVVAVETSAGELPADIVVAASGAEVPALCAPLGVHVPVVPSPAALLDFEAPQGLVRTLVASPQAEVRESGDGRLLATASWNADGPRDQQEQTARRTETAISATFRGADSLQPRSVRVGVRPMPADEAPIIGPVPSVPGLYLAVMHSGVTLAPMVGHLIAQEVVDSIEADELRDCRISRFTGTPLMRDARTRSCRAKVRRS